MKQFFLTLPCNVINCFQGRMILWHLLAILLTVILVLSGLDWQYFLYTRNPTLVTWMFYAAPVGGLVPIILPIGLILGGMVIRMAAVTSTGWAVGQAELMASLISSAYKVLTARAHPLRAVGPDISHEFHFGILRGGVFWGWPSSHTTIAFAMAGMIWTLFPERRWLGITAFLYALFIGLGVSMTIHWLSDFVAGAIIGTLIGTVVGRGYAASQEKDLTDGFRTD